MEQHARQIYNVKENDEILTFVETAVIVLYFTVMSRAIIKRKKIWCKKIVA